MSSKEVFLATVASSEFDGDLHLDFCQTAFLTLSIVQITIQIQKIEVTLLEN